MTPAVSALRALCLEVHVADDFARRGDIDGAVQPDFVRLARILFALTASTDPAVQAALDAAIATAERTR